MYFNFTIFGLALSLAYVLLYIRNTRNHKNFYMESLVLSMIVALYFDSGTYAFFGSMEIRVFEITFYYTFLLTVYTIIKEKQLNKSTRNWLLLILIFLVVNVTLIKAMPSAVKSVTLPNLWSDYFIHGIYQYPALSKSVFVYSIYILMTSLILGFFFNYVTKAEVRSLVRKISKLIYIPIAIFLFELLVKLAFSPRDFYVFRDFVMGSGRDVAYEIIRGGIPAFFGFNSEPSSFVYSLFLHITLFNLVNKGNQKNRLLGSAIISVIGFLSGSLLFVVYLLLIWFQNLMIYFEGEIGNKISRRTMLLSMVALVISIITLLFLSRNSTFFNYVIERFQKIIGVVNGEYVEYSSEVERLTSSFLMFKVFLSRPIFGAGMGTTYGFSAFFSLLSNVGIVGIALMLFPFVAFLRTKKKILTAIYYMVSLIFILTIGGNINNFIFTTNIVAVLIIFYSIDILENK